MAAVVTFHNARPTLAYDAALDAMVSAVDRRGRLDKAIIEMAADSVFTPVVTRLGCLRGVSTLTAFGLAVEIGDWHRLSGRSIGAYVGLVPTESSSGSTRSRVGHQDRQRPCPPPTGRSGLASPGAVSAEARSTATMGRRPRPPVTRPCGQPRLHARWAGFDQRKKRPVVANAAIARELAGWCWSLAVMPD